MTIYFRDELGEIAVDVDRYGISFDQLQGLAIFDDGENRYRVPITDIIEII